MKSRCLRFSFLTFRPCRVKAAVPQPEADVDKNHRAVQAVENDNVGHTVRPYFRSDPAQVARENQQKKRDAFSLRGFRSGGFDNRRRLGKAEDNQHERFEQLRHRIPRFRVVLVFGSVSLSLFRIFFQVDETHQLRFECVDGLAAAEQQRRQAGQGILLYDHFDGFGVAL